MDGGADLRQLLAEGRQIREVERGIFSALASGAPAGHYDRLAPVYDTVIGSRIYNRLVWKADREEYARFERQAIDSGDGWMLDAGCGSLVFTADEIAQGSTRRVVLLDYSLEMLRRARQRLERMAGAAAKNQQSGELVPENLILLQADLFDLPFRAGAFQTVSAPFVFHLFEDAASLVRSLTRVLAPDGGMFITSLVSKHGSRFSNWYLERLHRAGEVATPRDAEQALRIIEVASNRTFDHRQTGHVAYFWSDG